MWERRRRKRERCFFLSNIVHELCWVLVCVFLDSYNRDGGVTAPCQRYDVTNMVSNHELFTHSFQILFSVLVLTVYALQLPCWCSGLLPRKTSSSCHWFASPPCQNIFLPLKFIFLCLPDPAKFIYWLTQQGLTN